MGVKTGGKLLALCLLAATLAFGQTLPNPPPIVTVPGVTPVEPQPLTVDELPAVPTGNPIYLVTDSEDGSCSLGGGNVLVHCYWDGTEYRQVGIIPAETVPPATDLDRAYSQGSGEINNVTPAKGFCLPNPLNTADAFCMYWASTGFRQVYPAGPRGYILDSNSPLEIKDTSGNNRLKITSAGVATGTATTGTACTVLESAAAADDNMLFLSSVQAMTIKSVWCNYQGSAPSTVAVFALEDGDGNAMTHGSPVCAAPGTEATAQSVTAAGSLVAREVLRFDTTNTPDPATDTYMLCVSYELD